MNKLQEFLVKSEKIDTAFYVWRKAEDGQEPEKLCVFNEATGERLDKWERLVVEGSPPRTVTLFFEDGTKSFYSYTEECEVVFAGYAHRDEGQKDE